ncbi:MAG TPA: ABC transporter permease [Bacteroidota bacterium]|nr:ABC transporter permease [Bacteroidota bacterium]
MNLYSIRILVSQPLRLILTVGGVALCILLMLFLISVYHGVAEGSMLYIRHNSADLWVLQNNSWNILRGTSLLSTGHGIMLRRLPYVESASPILLGLPAISAHGRTVSTFLVGYDPNEPLGGPPHIVRGRAIENDDEIVLDEAFCARMGIEVGTTVEMNDEPLQVVGISSGTNAFVIQYSFVSLNRAQIVAGFSTIVSCYLVKIRPGYGIPKAAKLLHDDLPGVEVFDHPTFIENNYREMQSGFLPLLFTIATIGAIVLTVILSLLLSISILERRKDFAVMKTIGSPSAFLSAVVSGQALALCMAGSVLALVLFFPLCQIVMTLTPELSPIVKIEHVGVVVLAAAMISLTSSFISLQRLRNIYALEAFI